jgi:YidC/Oxa1 family membrane protein insertase
MKKYLDILLFTALFFLLFSYFSERNTPPKEGVIFSSVERSYTVPAGIQLQIENNTQTWFSLNTCRDISIRQDGKLIELSSEVCEDLILSQWQTQQVDFSRQYELFQEPGEYIFEFELGEQKYIQNVEVSYRGTLWKIFIGVFYAPIYNLMAYLIHLFSNSLGWAIIVITIIIRIVLLFPQHKMLVSQRKMQAIQPKIKALQEKYKGNQQQIGLELMKLYKQEWVNPLGSCWFLLIQMPFLLVIYSIIVHITSLKNEFYLYDFLPEFHISQIDPVFFGLNLLETGGVAWWLLALLVAGVQYLQVKLSLIQKSKADTTSGIVLEKKKDATDYTSFMPDPEMLNKFMLYGMPVMVGIFTFTLIAGVGVYWGISTFFAILQQLFVNKILKK